MLLLLGAFQVFAQMSGHYYLGHDPKQTISLQEMASQVKSGDIVMIGEEHNQAACASAQVQVLGALKKNGLHVNVGMEFLDITQQTYVDRYRNGELNEEDFLKSINWGGFDFAHYRDQILFPQAALQQELIALNAPRFLTSQIARRGIDSLDPTQRALLPPKFQKGRDSYFERFVSAIGHIKNPKLLENYFIAQSVWDDTMAYQATQFMIRKPDSVLVIIVGEFHSQYGGGLPDRIKERGFRGNLWTISQLRNELSTEMGPHPKYGERASYIWLF